MAAWATLNGCSGVSVETPRPDSADDGTTTVRESAGFKVALARASALASALIGRFAPGAFESAAAAVAAGGGNKYLLLRGLIDVLFTSVAMTRSNFACDVHVVRVASARIAVFRRGPMGPTG